MFGLFKQKVDIQELGEGLSSAIVNFINDHFDDRSDEEIIEIALFLTYQVHKLVLQRNTIVFQQVFKEVFNSNNFGKKITFDDASDAFNTRSYVYSNCNSLMGEGGGFPSKGSEIFALSYFLHSAAGETNIPLEDIKDVLKGNGQVDERNRDAFPDHTEILSLAFPLAAFTAQTKKFLDGLRF